MVEFVPIMLFILGWHPDRAGELDLQRPEILFASIEACEQTGTQIAERMSQAARDKSGAVYEYRCMASPSYKEFDAVLAQPEMQGR